MRWNVQWGGSYEDHHRMLAKYPGYDFPAEMGEPPEFLPGAAQYYRAFYDLCTERPQTGFGASRIPYGAVVQYAQFNGLGHPDEFELLWHCITAMDAEYLEVSRPELPEAGAGMFSRLHNVSERPMSPELFDAVFS